MARAEAYGAISLRLRPASRAARPAEPTATGMALEHDIVRLFDENLRGFFTIKTIASRLEKAYPFVHRKVHQLIDVGALRAVQVGGSKCVTLNLRSRRAVLYLTEIELEKRSKLPAEVLAQAKRLDDAGTLAIETVVHGAAGVFVVGTGHVPGARTITPEQLTELLLTTDLFKQHTVLAGYERFFAYLASIQTELDTRYNPLVVHP